MRINIAKGVLSLLLGMAIGFLLFTLAKSFGDRRWLAMLIAAVSVFICIGAAFACEYNSGHRNVNIKVTAWLMAILTLGVNVGFCLWGHASSVLTYVAVITLLVLVDVALIMILINNKADK